MIDQAVVAAMPDKFYVNHTTLTKRRVLARKPRIFGKNEWVIARTRVAEVELMMMLDLLELDRPSIIIPVRSYLMHGYRGDLDFAVKNSFAEYKTTETHDLIGIAA